MSSIVVIFLPGDKTRDDLAAAVRQFENEVESMDVPAAGSREPVADAEQLPLWQWFTF
ncbi:MAG TPA: hypothetical protein VHC44_19840 [Verrucomicrobiae bacterium]|nr:hypothetical protein [Verrucomicrobiae bacterium]